MPNAEFAANLIGGFFDTMGKERDRKDKNSLEAAKFLMSTGRVKDMNDLTPFLGPMLDAHGGGKGAKGKGGKGQMDPASILAQFVNPALQGGQSGAGQAQGGAPAQGGGKPLFTEDEMQGREQAAEKAKGKIQAETAGASAEAGRTGVLSANEKMAKKWIDEGMPEDEAYERAGLKQPMPKPPAADKDVSPDASSPTGYSRKYHNADGSLARTEPAPAPASTKETGPLANRVKELRAQGVSEAEAPKLAADQLQKERQTKAQQSSARLGAYLNLSRQALLSNTERYDEMKKAFPYVLASKVAGAETAGLRPELLKLAIDAKGAGNDKAKVDGQKEAAKIVEAATKQAKTLAAKESSILKGLGLEDDEATIRTNLIQEMSGGLDATAVEAMAKSRVSGAGAGSVTPADRLRARKYLQDNKLPVTDANIKHFLDGQKQPTVQ